MTTLEDILHKYKFVPKSKKVFRKYPKLIEEPRFYEWGTTAGYKGYSDLVSLLYDIAELTEDLVSVNKLIDKLDNIMSETY